MGLLAVCSAKGSPGASIVAMGLAALWPRASLLADVDPAGSDLIWRYRNQSGQPLDPEVGILSLGAGLRRAGAQIHGPDHVQQVAGGQSVLAGFAHPDQVTGLGPIWPVLADTFLGWPADVIADCGRLVPGSPALPVVARAEAVVFVVRPSAAGFAQLRERLRGLGDALQIKGAGHRRTFVLIVGSARDRRVVTDLQRILDSDVVGVQVLGVIAQDESAAAALGGQWNPRLGRSLLVRSLRAVIPQLEQLVAPVTWLGQPPATSEPGGNPW